MPPVELSDGHLYVAAAIALTQLVNTAARRGRGSRQQRHRDLSGTRDHLGMVEVIPFLPAGSRVEEVQPDGTIVRVTLPCDC
jgi:hypothetical protein